jgi:hypothetical protein
LFHPLDPKECDLAETMPLGIWIGAIYIDQGTRPLLLLSSRQADSAGKDTVRTEAYTINHFNSGDRHCEPTMLFTMHCALRPPVSAYNCAAPARWK